MQGHQFFPTNYVSVYQTLNKSESTLNLDSFHSIRDLNNEHFPNFVRIWVKVVVKHHTACSDTDPAWKLHTAQHSESLLN